ncbi:endonuclease/exonuclease/phosphatase family protein [Nocardioides zeae]|uniref:Endonuclease/exonuclease/phosphatase family protein n=1 Tax=Nocardioides imazamoxiresistens TaxID=3231893 RepID=A0ABU3Q2V0_9ACTN|nr:endonuclease/exonuclease/phosphatase family protein [Nocardioides zeae]MDT9595377.1 endonuclease/exonuclease/phosphatase family protein [Nocardioides zeae]
MDRALRVVGTMVVVGAVGGGVVAALAVVLLHHVSLTSTRWAAATSGVPWLLAAAVLALPVGVAGLLLTRRRRTALATAGVAVVLLAPAVWTQGPLLFGDDVTNDGPRLVVLTSNLEYGGADPDALVELVEARDVDVLFVQELTPAAEDALTPLLADVLPHHQLVPAETAVGSGIYARFPLEDAEALPDTFLTTVLATAQVPGHGAVRVGSAHPVAPWPVQRRAWEAELGQVREALHAVPDDLPVVVGGDFNATWDHPELRQLLDEGYRDAAEQSGSGWVRTWPQDRYVPLIGIDHVLVRGAQASYVESLGVPGTDHRAVLAEVVLP